MRENVRVITVNLFGNYIPIIKFLFPKAKIVLNRFHIIQHLNRAMIATRIAIMKNFDKHSLLYRAMKQHWRILQKDSRKLSNKLFYSRTFRQTVTPREVVQKTLDLSQELRYYYDMYQLLLFHFQQKNSEKFFELIKDYLPTVNTTFKTVFTTFLKYRQYVTLPIHLNVLIQAINSKQPTISSRTSNAKLEATNNIIKVIKRNAFGFRNFENFKKRILIAINIKKEKTKMVLSRC